MNIVRLSGKKWLLQVLGIAVPLIFGAASFWIFEADFRVYHSIMHIFYIPVIFAAFFWKRWGIIVMVPIAGIFAYFRYFSLDTFELYRVILRFFILLVVSIFTSFLSEWLSREREKNIQRINLFHSVKSIFFGEDIEGKVCVWNKGAENTLGLSEDKILGKTSEILFPKAMQKWHQTCVEEVKKGHSVSEHETRLISASGDEIDAVISYAPTKNTEGELIGVSIVATDITKQKLLEHELSLTTKLASMGMHSSTVAHEIASPAVTIRALCGLLRDEIASCNTTEQTWVFIERLDKAATHLVDIAKGVTGFVHSDPTESQDLNVHQEIEEAMFLMTTLLSRKHILIKTELEAQAATVKGQAGKIRQILVNLVSNAVDAIENVSSPGVRITSCNEDNLFILTVEDNGKGISEENLERIQEPFFTTKGKGKGTGLGLNIVQQCVRDLGGKVEFSSKINEGTTVTVTLPLSETVATEHPKLDHAHFEKEVSRGLALVVEDDPITRQFVSLHLKSLGFQCDVVGDVKTGFEMLLKKPYTHLIVDLKLPDRPGSDLVRELRIGTLKEIGKNMKIVVATGELLSYRLGEKSVLKGQVDGMIQKPFSGRELSSVLLSPNLQSNQWRC